jgi:tetratricopeptide (TPR) repeat protein
MVYTEEFYRKLKDEINELHYVKKEYTKAINKEMNMLNVLRKQKIKNINNFYFIYSMLALSHNQLNHLKEGLYYAKKASGYALCTTDIIDCNWVLGRCYSNFNKDKAIACYDFCIAEYMKLFDEDNDINNTKIKTNIAFLIENKALILLDDNLMNEAISIYTELYQSQQIDMYKYNEYINRTYMKMCKEYLKLNSVQKCSIVYRLLKKINNKQMYDEVLQQFSVVCIIK